MLPAAAYRHALALHAAAVAAAPNATAKWCRRLTHAQCLANARAAHPLAFPLFIS